MNWVAIAQAGYEAYVKRMQTSAAFADKGLLPRWEDLSILEKEAWMDAVDEACHVHVSAALA